MPKTTMDETGNGAGPVAHEEEANDRRQMMKQMGLAAGAMAATALVSSGASAASSSTDAEQRIIERALKDEGYRRRLIANPGQVVSEEVGGALPPGVQFKVLQETPDTVYIVLPHVPAMHQGRVSDRDLHGGAGMAFTKSWFRTCPACRCSSLSVCK
jgi:hypothetical protein